MFVSTILSGNLFFKSRVGFRAGFADVGKKGGVQVTADRLEPRSRVSLKPPAKDCAMFATARRLLVLGVSLVLSCATLGGCGAMPEDEAETSVIVQALATAKVAGPYGRTEGTAVGPGNNAASPVTAVSVWFDANNVHGLKLWWGTKSFLIGVTSGEQVPVMPGRRASISQVYLDIDGQNVVRGISMDSNLNEGIFSVGYFGDGVRPTLTGTDARLTDVTGYLGNVLGQTNIRGIKLNYTSN